MALSIRVLSTTFNNGSTSVSVSTGDVTDGELLVAVGDADTGISDLEAPAGWTLLFSLDDGANTGIRGWVKDALADNEPASYTWSMPSGSDGSVILCAVSADGTPLLDDSDAGLVTGSGFDIVAPSVLSTSDNGLLACFFWLFSGASAGRSITLPVSMDPLYQNLDSNGWHLRSGAESDVGSGATGTRTATASHEHTRAGSSMVFSEDSAEPGVREVTSHTDSITSDSTRQGTGTREVTSFTNPIVSEATRQGTGTREVTSFTNPIVSEATRQGTGTREVTSFTDPIVSEATRQGTGTREVTSFTNPIVSHAESHEPVREVISWLGPVFSWAERTPSGLPPVAPFPCPSSPVGVFPCDAQPVRSIPGGEC